MTAEQAYSVIAAVKTVAILSITAVVVVQMKHLYDAVKALNERGGSLALIGITAAWVVFKAALFSMIIAALASGYIKYVETTAGVKTETHSLPPHSPD